MQTKPICFSFRSQPFQQPIVKQTPYLFTQKAFHSTYVELISNNRNPFLLNPQMQLWPSFG
jgi:hypothetical protein